MATLTARSNRSKHSKKSLAECESLEEVNRVWPQWERHGAPSPEAWAEYCNHKAVVEAVKIYKAAMELTDRVHNLLKSLESGTGSPEQLAEQLGIEYHEFETVRHHLAGLEYNLSNVQSGAECLLKCDIGTDG